jgi:tetratricopeptide (TPR) repeat protein
MAALGIELPRTPRRALALTLWRRFTAILRGVDRPVSQQQKSLDPAQSERLDTLMRAVTSLSMVHPLRADALCAQLLIEVSNLADPSRRANAFALEAAWEATLPLGNLLNGRIEGLLNRSMGLAAETGRAADLEMALTARGISAYHQGRWEEAHAHIEQALRSLSAHGSNHWAVSICQIYCSHALALQGKLEALRPLRRAMIDGAERHADQVLLGVLRTGEPALIDLLDEGPEDSFARGEAAIAIWPAGEFLSPHYYHLISSVNALLALGRVEEAWTRMESRWPLAEEAMLVNVKVVGPHLRFTRGRVALHRFFQSGDPAALAVARACARHLRWSWSRTSQAWGAALQASLTAALRPQDRQAALRQAQEALGAANLGLYRWAASAQCLDHTVEVPLSSLSSTRARRVLHPRRLADLLMPMPRREI